MLETHPFGDFVPPNAKRLLLGSFTTKPMQGYQWFYANGRNQFWPILEEVYKTKLDTKEKQQQLFCNLEMALADIIYSCERLRNSNLDTNLTNITFNVKGIEKMFAENPIATVYFTSRFVETAFKKLFTERGANFEKLYLVYLPSPSPRYASISKNEKIKRYQELLPRKQ